MKKSQTLAARALAELGEARGAVKLGNADPRVRQEALLAIGDTADKGAREVAVK